MRKVTKLWKTRDGTKIRICDMSDEHLKNAMRMLERMHDISQSSVSYPCMQGDMAQYYAEQEWLEQQDMDVGDTYPIYLDLEKEQTRREELNCMSKQTYKIQVIVIPHKDGLMKMPDFGLGVGVLSHLVVEIDTTHPMAAVGMLDLQDELLRETVEVKITKLPPGSDQPAKGGPAHRKTKTAPRSRAGKRRGKCRAK